MRHFPAFDAVGSLCGKRRRGNKFYVNSCIDETCGSVHGYSVRDVAGKKPVRRFRTYCNVQRICREGSSLLQRTAEGGSALISVVVQRPHGKEN